MKIRLKNITLKEDTLNDISNHEYDTNKYINYIKTHLNDANYLIENKILSLDEEELYQALSKIFDIELHEDDLLAILGEKYNVHYTGTTTLKTNMVDELGNNIELYGAYTKKLMHINGIIPTSDLRKLVNSYDFLILETRKVNYQEKSPRPDKYEDYQFETPSLKFDVEDGLYDLKINLLKRKTKDKTALKKILAKVNEYVQELIFQAKYITKLDEKDNNLKEVCLEYKNAFESNFNRKNIFIEGNHKKRY